MDNLSLPCDILSTKYDYICSYLMMSHMKKVLLTLIVLLSTLATAKAQSFMDNTFIDGIVGVNQYFGSGTNIGAGTDVFFGKWFTPGFAARLGWHGSFGKEVSSQVVRGDLMLNITSKVPQLGIVPFLSFGGDFHNKSQNLLFGFGLEIAFGLTDRLSFLVDFALLSDFDPKDNSALPYFSNPSMPAGIGIRYNL